MSPEGDEAIVRPRNDALRRGAVDEGSVVQVAFCQTCGYDLRGLAVTGACPECGTPIATSLRGELLRDANPGRVALGFLLFVILIIVTFVDAPIFPSAQLTGLHPHRV